MTAEVTRGEEMRTVPAGSVWIPADQPLFELVVQLLEPEAPDSLFQWGYLGTVAERKEYIEPRVLDAWVAEQLADPAVAAEWHEALADEAFAADPGGRYAWWYRRHPSWDETVGLLPFYRLDDASVLGDVPRRPWR